jgi:hypothetical protein
VEARLPFTSYVKKRIPIDYSPHDSSFTNMQHDHWHTYAHVCVQMVNLWAQRKKHHVEHKLSDIFEALILSWV